MHREREQTTGADLSSIELRAESGGPNREAHGPRQTTGRTEVASANEATEPGKEEDAGDRWRDRVEGGGECRVRTPADERVAGEEGEKRSRSGKLEARRSAARASRDPMGIRATAAKRQRAGDGAYDADHISLSVHGLSTAERKKKRACDDRGDLKCLPADPPGGEARREPGAFEKETHDRPLATRSPRARPSLTALFPLNPAIRVVAFASGSVGYATGRTIRCLILAERSEADAARSLHWQGARRTNHEQRTKRRTSPRVAHGS